MPRLKENEAPSYRQHKQSGQAIVTLNGRDHLLGRFGTVASRREYQRLIGEWMAGGRHLPSGTIGLTITEMIDSFWSYARRYYVDGAGQPSGEADNFRMALRPLNRLYGPTVAAEFGPKSLKAMMIKMGSDPTADGMGWCRTFINRQAGRIKQVFRWAVENELLPASTYQAIKTVTGLRAGKGEARESHPVKSVPEAFIDAVLPMLSRQAAAMVNLQLCTGARPGEISMMRGIDIDTTNDVWTYRPSAHKTKHHGHERTIYLGPKAKEIIKPLLRTDLSAYIFSPAEAEAERRAHKSAARKTPLSCGNVPGSNRAKSPKRPPGERFDTKSYRRAISRACDRADALVKGGKIIGNDERIIPRWHPHQLRHNAGTRLRKEFGVEAAQVILGHRTLSVTELYAEKNVAAAIRIMGEVG